MPSSDDAVGLAVGHGALYDDPNDPPLKLILIHSHLALHRFTELARRYVEEDAWKDSLRVLLAAIMDTASRAKTATYVIWRSLFRSPSPPSCPFRKKMADNGDLLPTPACPFHPCRYLCPLLQNPLSLLLHHLATTGIHRKRFYDCLT